MFSSKSLDFSSYKNVRSHSDGSIIYLTEATISAFAAQKIRKTIDIEKGPYKSCPVNDTELR